MNTLEITSFIADMPAEVLEFLGINSSGQRISRSILHPAPQDRIVFEMIQVDKMINLPMLVRKTGLPKVQVTRALDYLNVNGLITVEGVRQSKIYFPAPDTSLDSELPEVKALPKGKKKKTDTNTVQVA